MEHEIRDAEVDDAPALGAIHVRAWQAAYRGVMPDAYLDGLQASERADSWRRYFAAAPSNRRLRVIVVDGGVVGFAGYGVEATGTAGKEVGELYVINLDPDAWGRGLGRAFLTVVTNDLASLGYREAVLWVAPQNERARSLYESAGWSADGGARQAELLGVVVSEIRYHKVLAGNDDRPAH